jgi:aspartate/methionine/tyrosine aminotransferase
MRLLEGEGAFEVMARARELEAAGRVVAHCEIGEPDATAPAHVVEAGMRALRNGDARYAPPQGLPELRDAVARALISRGVPATAETVVVTPGGKPALFCALLALLEPGDEVLTPDPGFPAFASVARFAGAEVVRYPLDAAGGFALSADAIAGRLSPRSRVLILNAPHNPTGGLAAASELERVAALVEREGLIVISDEVYARIVYGAAATSLAALPGLTARTIVVDSFSKAYAMSGWRLGYAVVPESLAEPITRLVVNSFSCAPPFVQRAGIAALTGPQQPVEAMVDALRRRRDQLVNGLAAVPGVRCSTPAGAFFAFPDVRAALQGSGLDTAAFARRLLDDHGLACLPGTAFGPGGAGHLRLSYAATPATIERALAALSRATREISSCPSER